MTTASVEEPRVFRIVYEGIALGGRYANLAYIHARTDAERRSNLVSGPTLANEDGCVVSLRVRSALKRIDGRPVELLLAGAHGAAFAVKTREELLWHADGVVFVVDSSLSRGEQNKMWLDEASAWIPKNTPCVVQYNKRDLPSDQILSIEELRLRVNPTGLLPEIEASATNGTGVFATLKTITDLVIERASASASASAS